MLRGNTDFVNMCVRAGVSKLVTVDVRGSWQRWLKVRDLIRGATYTFSVQALTVSYGPPVHANVSAQPVQGRPAVTLCVSTSLIVSRRQTSVHLSHYGDLTRAAY